MQPSAQHEPDAPGDTSPIGDWRARLMLPALPLAPIARLKAWVDYGMTQPRIAKAYGVTVSVVEKLL